MAKGKVEDRVGTRKTAVIEAIFLGRWNAPSRTLARSMVTLREVEDAIREYNASHPEDPLSTRNAANFFKDFVRNRGSANRNWPKVAWDAGYTGRQRTGENACFEFVPKETGQEEPFPDRIPGPPPDLPVLAVESISLPLASRRLGRRDETWFIQVLVRLRVLETHFALSSDRRIVQLDHLQIGVKLRKAEIDALFLALEQVAVSEFEELLVSCEAKIKDDILPDQLLAQVRALFQLDLGQRKVLPIAAKVIGNSLVHVVEFDAVTKDEIQGLETLSVVKEGVYHLVPDVPGIR